MAKSDIKKERIIIGIHGQTGSGKSLFTIRHVIPLFKRILIMDTMGDYDEFTVVQDIESLKDALSQNVNSESFIISYQPFDDNAEGFFVLAEKMVNTTIIVEEIGAFTSPHSIDPNLNKIVQYGRHFRQSLVYLSRTPAETNRFITSQVNVIISFIQIEPIHIEYFKKISFEANKLSELEKYSFPDPIEENKHYMFIRGKDEFMALTKKT